MSGALVLGGGGVAGIAWITGVLAGLADAGADVTGAGVADLVVGTSAGSAVAAQLGSGRPLDELYARQVDPARQNREIRPTGVSVPEVLETWTRMVTDFPDAAVRRRRAGELARAARTVPEAERRAVIEDRLPSASWPRRRILITAVDAVTGEPRVFDRDSGVSLVDAVAASCAVPMVWPTVRIGGVPYMDGGMRSTVNADLAAGHDPIVIIAPMPDPDLDRDVADLSRAARVRLITPDERSLAAIGADPLDPDTRTPSAEAGRAQGVEAAPLVRGLLTS